MRPPRNIALKSIAISLPMLTLAFSLYQYCHYANTKIMTTQGIVDEIRLHEHNTILSHYTVDGRRFQLQTSTSDGKKYQEKDTIIIYYDSGRPENASYDRYGFSVANYLIIFIFVTCGCLFLYLIASVRGGYGDSFSVSSSLIRASRAKRPPK